MPQAAPVQDETVFFTIHNLTKQCKVKLEVQV